MYILGISAYYHDSAAILLKDGKVVCGIEEERFTRIKHDNGFPFKAIEFCLKEAGLMIDKIDVISYYEKPLLKFERILETFIITYPWSLKPFLKGIPEWIDYKIKIEHTIRTKLKYEGRITFTPHHLSHAAAAFYTSPFNKSAILTIDGVGEYQTTGLWLGKDNKIIPLKKIDFPHSLGLLYSTFTAFLGFKVNEDEYKLMGLAAYGKPKYTDLINQLIDTRDDGSFKLNMKYFSFRESFQMWNLKFEKLLGPPRKPKGLITQRHKNLATSIQAVTENIYFSILNHLSSILPGIKNVCVSGGVALNALANGKIYLKTPFKNVHIFGAAGDSGAALGSALFTHRSLTASVEEADATSAGKTEAVNRLSFGSSYSNSEIESVLKHYHLKYQRLSEKDLIAKSSQLIANGYIIGWFQCSCELGPRALGNRSILCAPGPTNMKTKMNMIKRREMFRPFAGSILQEKVHEYFEVPEKNHFSPFMVFCFPVRREKRKELAAIVHADGTCRIQTVRDMSLRGVSAEPDDVAISKSNSRYYKLIKQFYKLTGIPCILNTSFNLMGEPIVETPKQAIEDFLKTKIDYLVIGDFLIPHKLAHESQRL